jgi:hypothetical protein
MATGNEYLEGLVTREVVSEAQLNVLRGERQRIEAAIRTKYGSGPRIYYAGSYGKRTMIASHYDLDIVVYFPKDSSLTLSELYWGVNGALKDTGLIVQTKNVAIRLPYQSSFHIDVVPGRAIDDDFLYANLYKSETGGWLQTSIKIHIDTVRQSGLPHTIRLMKLWNYLHGLNIRGFALELLTIRALKDTNYQGYDTKLMAVFAFLRDHLARLRLVDPANSGNVISDLMDDAHKRAVASAAGNAVVAPYWEHIVW